MTPTTNGTAPAPQTLAEALSVRHEIVIELEDEDEYQQCRTEMDLAYGHIAEHRAESWALHRAAQAKWVRLAKKRHHEAGFHSAPLFEEALWRRIDPVAPDPSPGRHIALLAAMQRDIGSLLDAHIQYRMLNEGNVILQITGPTGMGKSSIALTLADSTKPIPPGKLEDHVAVHQGEVGRKLSKLKQFETLIVDEFIETAGEGSRTDKGETANIERTIRKTCKNVIYCSPERQDHETSQFEMEVVLWNPDHVDETGQRQGLSLVIVWVNGFPHGHAIIPWARPELWREYQPIKQRMVDSAEQAHFRPQAPLMRDAVELMKQEAVQEYFLDKRKVLVKHCESAVSLFLQHNLAGPQEHKLAGLLHDLLMNWNEKLRGRFEKLYGVSHEDVFDEVAKHCQE